MMAELDQVLATRELDYTTAFSHLPFTMAVIKETLRCLCVRKHGTISGLSADGGGHTCCRLFPSVPVDQKVAKADDILPGGMHVPKGVRWKHTQNVRALVGGPVCA